MIEMGSRIDINKVEVEAFGIGWLVHVYIHILSCLYL
jgi:hypothetical protein